MASKVRAPPLPTTEFSTTITRDDELGLGLAMNTLFFERNADTRKYLVVEKVQNIFAPDGDSSVTTTADVVVPSDWDAKGRLLNIPDAPDVLAPEGAEPGDTIFAGTVLAQVS